MLKGPNTQHSGHMGQDFFQTESMSKIYSKSPVRATVLVKYYSCNLARTPIKTHKNYEKWPLFVINKQLFWWTASITLDINNNVLADF